MNPEDCPVPTRNFRRATNCSESTLKQADPTKVVHVMSYNVLADGCCRGGGAGGQKEMIQDFSYRGPRVLMEVA